MGGKSSTSTSSTTIPPEVLARYNSVNATAEQAAQTPFQQYSTNPNAFVAPLTAEQNTGIANTNTYANTAQPYYQAATGLTAAGSGAANLGSLNTNQYLSPYLNDVVGATYNQLQNQNQQQSSALQGSAIQAGAFGGDRSGIAQGNLANQQSLANGQTISGLLNTGYQQAQGVAQQQQGAQLSADQANLARLTAGGAQLANIGNEAQTSGLQGASAQLAAGQTQQQTQQAGLTALYNQFLQQQSYPFQTAQFLANIAEGTGALSGSTTTTTQPSSFFSDERLKEDIEPIGKTFDGQNIVKFRYKNSPRVHMGLIAQDVEKKHPHAVGLAGGFRTVDYDEATEPSAKRGHFRSGGLIPMHFASGGDTPMIDTTGMSPYGGASRFEIDPLVLRHLMISNPISQSSPTNDLAQLSTMGNNIKSLYGDARSVYNGVTGNTAQVPTQNARGGRTGFADGGLPYENDDTDPNDPNSQHKPALGLSIPDEANTHTLQTPQNPTGSTQGSGAAGLIGGLASTANNAKNIYGLGSSLASALAPAAPAAADVAGASGALGAVDAGAAGAGSGLWSTLAAFLPFLATGGSVGRGHYDDGGTVDPNAPLQDLDDADLARRLAAQENAPVAPVAPSPASVAAPAPPSKADAIAADVLATYGNNAGAPPSSAANTDTAPTGLVPPLSPPVTIPAAPRPHPIIEANTPPAAPMNDNSGGGDPLAADQVWNRMIHQESGGNQFDPKTGQPLTSSAGAVGIAQVMPGTAPIAAQLAGLPWDPVKYRTDAAYNEALGRAYYNKQVETFGGNTLLGAAAYNAGPGAVQTALQRASMSGGDFRQYLPAETQKYLSIVGNGASPSSDPMTTGSTGLAPSAGNPTATSPSGGLMGELGDAASWLNNPSPGRNLLFSALSGLGKMASSNSRYLGSAVLQGLGGAADTYQGLQAQQAGIAHTNAGTANIGAQTGLTNAQTQLEKAALYQRMVIPNDGTYVLDKSNPYAGMIKVADAEGRTLPNISPALQAAGMNAPLASSGAAPGNTGSPPISAPSTTPATGAGSGSPQQYVQLADLKPASSNPATWSAVTTPPANYKPGVDARYSNFASDPAGGSQVRQTAINDAAKMHDAANSAVQTQQNMASMKDAYQNLTPNQTGPLHQAYMDLGGKLNSFTNALGLGDAIDPQAFASGQEVDKLHGALAQSMGGTKGAQLFADIASAVPGGNNTPLGFARISSSVDQMAQRTRDLSAWMDNYANQYSTLNGAQEAFDAQNPPESYAAKAVYNSVPPAAVQQLQTFVKSNPKAAPAAMKGFDNTFGKGTAKLVLGQ